MNTYGLEVSKSLFMRRNDNGSVTITHFPPDAKLPANVSVTIDPVVWAFAIATVSKLGALPDIITAAMVLHEGVD